VKKTVRDFVKNEEGEKLRVLQSHEGFLKSLQKQLKQLMD